MEKGKQKQEKREKRDISLTNCSQINRFGDQMGIRVDTLVMANDDIHVNLKLKLSFPGK